VRALVLANRSAGFDWNRRVSMEAFKRLEVDSAWGRRVFQTEV
jgi:hypothetical protein